MHRELLIGGVFLGGECDQGIGKGIVRSPYDGQVVGSFAEAGPSEVEAAVAAAEQVFEGWSRTTGAERAVILRAIAEALRARKEEFAELAALEIGKPMSLARGELERAAITFDLSAEIAQTSSAETEDFSYDPRGVDYLAKVARFPIGPVLCITPYNWPFNLAAHKIGPALAAGNTVVLKGSPLASICTLSLARLIHEAGCPPGVVNAIAAPTPLAARLPGDPRIAMVSFTGSPEVGWMIRRQILDKRVTLELGGDASAIVCDDANLEWAARRCAVAGFAYAGQVCISLQHVLAQDSVYDSLRSQLVAEAEAMPYGDPRHPPCLCGPMISSEAADRVMEWLQEAEDAGGTVLTGGSRIGNVVLPTVVEFPESWAGAPPRLACDEVFGPVVTLSRFDTFESAIDKVNQSQYGIHAGLFTRDEGRIDLAFRALEVGGLVVNDAPNVRFDGLPYGGVKRSGLGREGVRAAYESMTEVKTLVRRSAWPKD